MRVSKDEATGLENALAATFYSAATISTVIP